MTQRLMCPPILSQVNEGSSYARAPAASSMCAEAIADPDELLPAAMLQHFFDGLLALPQQEHAHLKRIEPELQTGISFDLQRRLIHTGE